MRSASLQGRLLVSEESSGKLPPRALPPPPPKVETLAAVVACLSLKEVEEEEEDEGEGIEPFDWVNLLVNDPSGGRLLILDGDKDLPGAGG